MRGSENGRSHIADRVSTLPFTKGVLTAPEESQQLIPGENDSFWRLIFLKYKVNMISFTSAIFIFEGC